MDSFNSLTRPMRIAGGELVRRLPKWPDVVDVATSHARVVARKALSAFSVALAIR